MGKIRLNRSLRIAQVKRSDYGQGDSIGVNWYAETRKSINYFFDSDASLFAGFLASTSANATVKANLSLALKVFIGTTKKYVGPAHQKNQYAENLQEKIKTRILMIEQNNCNAKRMEVNWKKT